jgi:hypothetical protein
MQVRRCSIALLATGMAAALAAALPSLAGATPAVAQTGTPVPESPDSVTLITGDRVTVSPNGIVFEPAPGRASIGFTTQTSDGHRYVIPTDALPLLRRAAGPEVFDVTALQEFGYGAGADLPLLLA